MAYRKLGRSDGLPQQIPPQFFQDLELRIVRDEAELWWRGCGLLAWSCVRFSRDYLVRAWMAHLNGDEKSMVAAADRGKQAAATANLLWSAHLKRVDFATFPDEIPEADEPSASPKPERPRRGPQGPRHPISEDAFQRFDDLVAKGLLLYPAARRVIDERLMSGSGTPASLAERLVKAAQKRAKPSS